MLRIAPAAPAARALFLCPHQSVPLDRRILGEGGPLRTKGETETPRTYKPRIPAGEPRPKTGGRGNGTPNKSTVAFRDAVLSVFADMQARIGEDGGPAWPSHDSCRPA